MKGPVAKSVDEYLMRLPDAQRTVLQKVRKAIKETAPKAEESISYMIPAYKYKWALVYFAAFTNHCSLFGATKSILKTFEEELRPFKTNGGTIHFTPEKPLPIALIKRIVKMRMKENEERHMQKTVKKKKAV